MRGWSHVTQCWITYQCEGVEVAFKGGGLASAYKLVGWKVKLANSPWTERLEIFCQRIQLSEEWDIMDYCIVCATFTTLMSSVKYNWAKEIWLCMQKIYWEVGGSKTCSIDVCKLYGSLCQWSVASNSSSYSRLLPPSLNRLVKNLFFSHKHRVITYI